MDGSTIEAWVDAALEAAAQPGARDAIVLGGLCLVVLVALIWAIRFVRSRRPPGFEDERTLTFQGVFATRVPDRPKAIRTSGRLRRFDPVRLESVAVPGQDRLEIQVSARGVALGHLDRFSGEWVDRQRAAGGRVRAVFWDRLQPKSQSDPICVIALKIWGGQSAVPTQPK